MHVHHRVDDSFLPELNWARDRFAQFPGGDSYSTPAPPAAPPALPSAEEVGDVGASNGSEDVENVDPVADAAKPAPQRDLEIGVEELDNTRKVSPELDPASALEVITRPGSSTAPEDDKPVEEEKPAEGGGLETGNAVGFRVDDSGDLLWTQMNKYLVGRNGDKPVTDTDIANALEALAVENGTTSSALNTVNVGDSFVIPGSDKIVNNTKQLTRNAQALLRETTGKGVSEEEAAAALGKVLEADPAKIGEVLPGGVTPQNAGAVKEFVAALPDGDPKKKLTEALGKVPVEAPDDGTNRFGGSNGQEFRVSRGEGSQVVFTGDDTDTGVRIVTNNEGVGASGSVNKTYEFEFWQPGGGFLNFKNTQRKVDVTSATPGADGFYSTKDGGKIRISRHDDGLWVEEKDRDGKVKYTKVGDPSVHDTL